MQTKLSAVFFLIQQDRILLKVRILILLSGIELTYLLSITFFFFLIAEVLIN